MKEFCKALLPLRRRLTLEAFLRYFLWCMIMASGLALAVFLLSAFVVLPERFLAAGALWLAGFLAALCVALFWKRPGWKAAAEAADRLGGRERMITTLELLARDSRNEMEEMAVRDGMKMAKERDFAKEYRFRPPKKPLALLCLLLALTFGAAFLPSPKEEGIEAYTQAEIARIEKVSREIEKEETLDSEERAEFRRQTQALTKELKKAATKKEVEQAVQKAQQEMKKLEKNSIPKDLREMAKGLEQNEKTKELADALNRADEEAIQAAMQALMEQLAGLSAEQQAELAEMLAQAAGELSDEELREALEELAEALENGANLTAAGERLTAAAKTQAGKNASLRAALQKMNGQLAAGQNQGNGQGNGQGQGQGNGQGQGQGNGQGQGQGNGQGQGQGNGQGQGQGNGQGAGQSSGQGRGFGHQETERVFTRNAEGKAGFDAKVEGQENESGQTSMTEHRTMGEAGESLPYERVYQTYRNEAMKTLEEENVPYGMREMVAEYFSALE